MKQAESALKTMINGKLKSLGAMVFNVHGHVMQSAGWPDTQVYHARWVGHIEYKVNDRPCTALQRKVIGDLLLRGVHVLVVRRILGEVIVELPTGEAVATLNASLQNTATLLGALRLCGDECVKRYGARYERST